jgi:hypothetical protein
LQHPANRRDIRYGFVPQRDVEAPSGLEGLWTSGILLQFLNQPSDGPRHQFGVELSLIQTAFRSAEVPQVIEI